MSTRIDVDDDRRTVGFEHDIVGIDVVMGNAEAMEMFYSASNINSDLSLNQIIRVCKTILERLLVPRETEPRDPIALRGDNRYNRQYSAVDVF
jgi:hypothetical protein